ncbi:hypothetical protein GGR52DRAFT_473693 [Hypoxylon sp. FL1284]|nr:hypothetical protein GGR52DRAFT_473693 [Hypoxylon sp. FL1284]
MRFFCFVLVKAYFFKTSRAYQGSLKLIPQATPIKPYKLPWYGLNSSVALAMNLDNLTLPRLYEEKSRTRTSQRHRGSSMTDRSKHGADVARQTTKVQDDFKQV